MNLIVGATGTLGGMIARRLLADGKAVRVLARPGSTYGPLEAAGAQVALGDLRQPASLAAACQGAQAIIATAAARITEDESATRAIELDGYGSLIAAAKTAGVERFVYISAFGADPHSPIPYLSYKGQVEAMLRDSGIAYTILQPDWIMDAWFMYFVFAQAAQGLPVWAAGDGRDRHSPVAVQDLAAFAIAALERPAALNRVIPVGGPQVLSLCDAVEYCERVLGMPVEMRSFSAETPPPGWPPLLVQLMLGFAADTVIDAQPAAQELGVRLTTLDEFVQSALAAAPAG